MNPTFKANAVFAFFTQLIDRPLMGSLDAIVGTGLTQAGAVVLAFGTIAIALYGMGIAAGWYPHPAQGFGKLVAKLAFFSLVVSASTYSWLVRDAVLVAMPAHITALVNSGAGVATDAAAYDVVWNQAVAGGLSIWNELSKWNPLLLLVMVFFVVALLAVLAGYGIWLLGHIMAVIYVALGPVFIPCAFFAPTRPMFSAWVGCTLSAVVLQGLSIILTSLLVGAETAIVRAMAVGNGADFSQRLAMMFAAIAVFALCGWWASKLPAAAASLCGGIHFAPNLLVAATYGAVAKGGRAALGAAGSVASQSAQAAYRRVAAPAQVTPPGPTLSRAQPAMTGPNP